MSDKNFKVKNGIDANGTITVNSVGYGKALVVYGNGGGTIATFYRDGVEYGGISDWASYSGTGINIMGTSLTSRGAYGIDSQSFFNVGYNLRSAAGFMGTDGGSNPVVYISSVGSSTNDLLQFITPTNAILAKFDYLGNLTVPSITVSGNLTVNGTTTNLNSTNLVIEDKNIILADVATPTDTTADGGGITLKGATDKIIAWSNTSKSWESSDPFIITTPSASVVPLTIKTAASQTANPLEIKDSSGNILFYISNPAGNFAYNNRVFIRPGGTGGMAQVGSDAFGFRLVTGGGSSISLGTGGGGTSFEVVASDTFNRYKIQGTGTGVAPIFTTDGNDTDVNMNIYPKGAGKIGINTTSPDGYVHIKNNLAASPGLVVQAPASQTGNLQEWRDASGNVIAKIGPLYGSNIFQFDPFSYGAGSGYSSIFIGGRSILNEQRAAQSKFGVTTGEWALGALRSTDSQVGVFATSTTLPTFTVKSVASQTANIQEWQNSSGTVLNTITSSGTLVIGGAAPLNTNFGLTLFNKTLALWSTDNGTGFASQVAFARGNTGGAWMLVGQTGDGSNGPASIDIADGGNNKLYSFGYNGNTIINVRSTSAAGLTINAPASYAANFMSLKDSGGNLLSRIAENGQAMFPRYWDFNTQGEPQGARIALTSTQSASPVAIFRGVSGQTANLQEWQDSTGTVLSSINNVGALVSTKDIYVNGYRLGKGAATTGSNNTAFGLQTLNSNTTGSGNFAFGLGALQSNTTGSNNFALGNNSLINTTTADLNMALGSGVMFATTTGYYNTGIGYNALTALTTGYENLAIGISAGTGLLTGYKNTFIGLGAGSTNITGYQNVFLGYNAGSNETGSNKLYISNSNTSTPLIGGDFSAKTLSFAGNTTITSQNTTTQGLIVKGAASQTANLQEWQDSSGNIVARIASNGLTQLSYSNYSYNGPTVAVGDLAYGLSSEGAYLRYWTSGQSGGGHIWYGGSNSGSPVRFLLGNNGNTVIQGISNQTANLTEWKNSSGTVLASIDASGNMTLSGPSGQVALSVGTNGNSQFNTGGIAGIGIGASGYHQLNVYPGTASRVGIRVLAQSSQTGDLQQWTNSSGTVLASVDASGNISDISSTKWLSPIGSGSDDAPTVQALIDAGKKEIRLGSGQWTFSTRIKIPNGVTLTGIGASSTSTTGTRVNAVALIASEGTVRDITFTGAGENSQTDIGGGIAVLGGRVIDCSVTNSKFVLAPTRQAHGYLKNFMSKMQSPYGSVKVAILGDSLSENTSNTSWYGYLFNSATSATGYYLGSYCGHQIGTSEVDNLAIGGQGAYLLSAQLAMTKETLRTGGYVNQVLDGDRVSSSPFFNRGYNLAIIAIGQNGGEDWKAHLEYVVKTIRDKGIDVILLTQNPAAGNPTSRAGDEYYYRSMAETYGCLLIDTQAYYRLEVEFGRALGTTADLFGDSIHQSTQGHQLYAKAILNGILDYDSTITVPSNNVVSTRSYLPPQADRASAIAGLNTYYLVKKPDSARDISGVTYTTATDTSIKNPIYGRGTTTNSVTTIASSGYATWGVEYATAAYIIYRENATTNTLTVAIQGGGSTLATLTTGVTNGRTSVQKVMLAGGYPTNRPIRITNTSGDPVQIYGVVFETHADVAFNRNADGSYPGLTLSGAWSTGDFLQINSYGGLPTPYTSSTNAYASFKFYGDGLRFTTSYGKNSGILQVKIDDTTYTAVDTYNNINEYGTYTHFYGGLEYGLHTATITLTGANASVTGNNSDGARFGLHRIAAVRSSWYLTQDQQFDPSPDTSAKVTSLASPTIGSVGTNNIMNFYNGANGYGAGAIAYNGTFNINGANIGFPYTSTGATVNINATSATNTPLSVRAYASQTYSLQEWQSSNGTAVSRIDQYGGFVTNVYASLYPSYTGGTPLFVNGLSGQTGDLTRWQNSSAAVLAKIDSAGNFSAVTKSFDIVHPTKENMRLRYGSLEGPENGVYIRGTVESDTISLPDYWTGLVDKDSITVSLTSVGSSQNIYVEKIENNTVYIGGEIKKAFFTIYAERKDVDKLIVEY